MDHTLSWYTYRANEIPILWFCTQQTTWFPLTFTRPMNGLFYFLNIKFWKFLPDHVHFYKTWVVIHTLYSLVLLEWWQCKSKKRHILKQADTECDWQTDRWHRKCYTLFWLHPVLSTLLSNWTAHVNIDC